MKLILYIRPLVVILSLSIFLRVYDFLGLDRPSIISVETKETVIDKQPSNDNSKPNNTPSNKSEQDCLP
jgi:hypothetical protein